MRDEPNSYLLTKNNAFSHILQLNFDLVLLGEESVADAICEVRRCVWLCYWTLKMSTLSVRAPLQTTTLLDSRSMRVRGVTTLDGVRRNLFGCTDREENRRFAERELARQLELDSQKWGFDFAQEKPLPGDQRFEWRLVAASAIPAALRRAPITITTPQPAAPKQEVKVSSPESSKTQKRITGKFRCFSTFLSRHR